jgi:23S rRNA (cytidine1920-2'-O)/16S rRNA (cytidine1409-2'-O)-methyltransferase
MDFGLRNDPRMRLLEKTNARYLTRDTIASHVNEGVEFIAMDVSFISATLVLLAVVDATFGSPTATPAMAGAVEAPPAAHQIVVLVKPQFEVGRELVGKGGIVRDQAAQQSAVKKVETALVELGGTNLECIESPILGGEGNREFLLHAVFPADQ